MGVHLSRSQDLVQVGLRVQIEAIMDNTLKP
jgi:hypothetical protein